MGANEGHNTKLLCSAPPAYSPFSQQCLDLLRATPIYVEFENQQRKTEFV